MKRAVYPGTFDPMTKGHEDLVRRAANLFDHVVVAIAASRAKHPFFTIDERVAMAREVLAAYPNVEVRGFSGLLMNFLKELDAKIIVRGLRAVSDFEFEFQLALMNRKLDENIETIFMMPKDTYTFLSSRIVKEICRLGGDVSSFVPAKVQTAMKKKLKA